MDAGSQTLHGGSEAEPAALLRGRSPAAAYSQQCRGMERCDEEQKRERSPLCMVVPFGAVIPHSPSD